MSNAGANLSQGMQHDKFLKTFEEFNNTSNGSRNHTPADDIIPERLRLDRKGSPIGFQ